MAKRTKLVPESGALSRSEDQAFTPEPEVIVRTGLKPSQDALFPVVGIGASAGGVKAFETFFSAMPTDTDPGMAFVLVQHLAPDHKSILTELVKRYTRMQVFEVENGMVVQPNCAYIIPPNRDMAFLNGALQLLEPAAPRGQRLPIDFFFRSLAQDQHERAICIVLSGTGSDGTLGVREVKGEGGMVMVQAPDSTEYEGMPRSAIATGLVDYVLPVAEMPAQLISYVTHLFGRASHFVSPPTPQAEDFMKKIFVLLRSQTGHNFSQYKLNTVLRRIERRMAVHRIEKMEDYVRYLQKHTEEVDALFRDLLIGVTQFFRDPAAFNALQKQVIPKLFEGKAPGASIRIWVPGCSTGEEAYSIAILLQEYMEAMKLHFNVQIFATDIDSRSINQARTGLYPYSIAADITLDRLSRFFTPEPDGLAYRIHKGIRDLLIFSEQDVIRDPPFSKLDLISCRNLMIYMGGELQKKLIPLFHYALNPGGKLFLGTSESVGEFHDLFSDLDRKAKLYQRKDDVLEAGLPRLGKLLPSMAEYGVVPRPFNQASREGRSHLREIMERSMLQHLAPVGALVSENGDILYLQGRTGRYLEPAPGESSLNMLKMAREGLRRELTTALHKAVMSKEPVLQRGLRVKTNGDFSTVDLSISPVTTGPGAVPELYYLVVLEESADQIPEQTEAAIATKSIEGAADFDARVDARILAMKQELKVKEEYLQATNEELEISNEELRSSLEELQTVNEELQSTTEEMETSKEELQSVNEELATVNAELQQKVVDLSRANNDMSNLLAGTGVGTIFVDHRLCIQRFTPAATQVINLILTDIGRPIGHLVSNLVGYDRLVPDIRAVLDTLVPSEIEVQSQAGTWYLLRIRPYRTLENVIEGAVITFTEITELKQAQAAATRKFESVQRLAAVVQDAYDAITLQDLEGRILAWNPGAERFYGWSEAEALGRNIRDMIPEGRQEEALNCLQKLSQAETLESHRTQRKTKDGRIVDVWLTATVLLDETRKIYAIATTERVRRLFDQAREEGCHEEGAQP